MNEIEVVMSIGSAKMLLAAGELVRATELLDSVLLHFEEAAEHRMQSDECSVCHTTVNLEKYLLCEKHARFL